MGHFYPNLCYFENACGQSDPLAFFCLCFKNYSSQISIIFKSCMPSLLQKKKSHILIPITAFLVV